MSGAFFDNELKSWVYSVKSTLPRLLWGALTRLREITELPTDKKWVESLGCGVPRAFWTFGWHQRGEIFSCSVDLKQEGSTSTHNCVVEPRVSQEHLQRGTNSGQQEQGGLLWWEKGFHLGNSTTRDARNSMRKAMVRQDLGFAKILWKSSLLNIIPLFLCYIPA